METLTIGWWPSGKWYGNHRSLDLDPTYRPSIPWFLASCIRDNKNQSHQCGYGIYPWNQSCPTRMIGFQWWKKTPSQIQDNSSILTRSIHFSQKEIQMEQLNPKIKGNDIQSCWERSHIPFLMIFRFPFGGIWTRSPQGLSLLESLESPGKPTGIIQIEMGLPTGYNKHRKNHLRHFLQGYSHIITPIIAFIYDVFWRVFTQGFRLVKHTSSPDTKLTPTIGPLTSP